MSEKDLLWRESVQRAVRTSLAADPIRDPHLDLGTWRDIKERRASRLRAALGRVADPGRTGVRAAPPSIIRSKTHEYPEFTIESIVLDAFDGWLVGLSLFLPHGSGPFIPVLCPCGHGPKWQSDHQIPPQVLARNGFAAALFDMPMFGEKQRDNDHFVQGAQLSMVGQWSNEWFLLDAIRSADYLETRDDITFAHGMGVTGVSGGGLATQFLGVVDDRTSAIAPVCSTAPFGGYLIEGLYTGCPETYLFGQAIDGMDADAALCLSAPLPVLVQGGAKDVLFKPDLVAESVGKARRVYELEGVPERVSWREEDVPHTYTATMAGSTAQWFMKWLGDPKVVGDVHLPCESAGAIAPVPTEDLDCGTAETTMTMLDVVRSESARLRSKRRRTRGATTHGSQDIADALHLDLSHTPAQEGQHPKIESNPPESGWGYPGLIHHTVNATDGLPIPGVEISCPNGSEGSMLCLTESHPIHALSGRSGMFGVRRRLWSASVRGFGELTPRPTEYDVHAWCSVDRPLSDLIALCGETAMGQQTADALSVIAAMSVGDSGSADLSVYGEGEAALPALFAGLIDDRVSSIITHRMLIDFATLATDSRPSFHRYSFVSGILVAFDLPELIGARSDKRFLIIDPVDARKEALELSEVENAFSTPDTSHVDVQVTPGNGAGNSAGNSGDDPTRVREVIRRWLNEVCGTA